MLDEKKMSQSDCVFVYLLFETRKNTRRFYMCFFLLDKKGIRLLGNTILTGKRLKM